jgi:hypothetical protein
VDRDQNRVLAGKMYGKTVGVEVVDVDRAVNFVPLPTSALLQPPTEWLPPVVGHAAILTAESDSDLPTVRGDTFSLRTLRRVGLLSPTFRIQP